MFWKLEFSWESFESKDANWCNLNTIWNFISWTAEDILEIKDDKRGILTLFPFMPLIKYLFIPDPLTSTFLLLFSYCDKTIDYSINSSLLEQENEYATLRAWCFF